MIENTVRQQESTRHQIDVTEMAIPVSWQMCRMFTGCNDAVVANIAPAGNVGVVKTSIGCKQEKTFRVVAIATLFFSGNMLGRFSDSRHAVVTGTAVTEHFKVVHICNLGKAKRRMAGLTKIRCRHVVC